MHPSSTPPEQLAGLHELKSKLVQLTGQLGGVVPGSAAQGNTPAGQVGTAPMPEVRTDLIMKGYGIIREGMLAAPSQQDGAKGPAAAPSIKVRASDSAAFTFACFHFYWLVPTP